MLIRDRIVELRRVKAGELRPSPHNWRTHPQSQRDALRGVLNEIGFAGAVLAWEAEESLRDQFLLPWSPLRLWSLPDGLPSAGRSKTAY